MKKQKAHGFGDGMFFPDRPRGSLDDTAAIRELLIATARNGRALTYSETLGALGYRFSRPKMRWLCRIIGDIDEAAKASGEPELAVLVVRASDGMPGEGWWRGQSRKHACNEGARKNEALKFVGRCQAAAFAYWRDVGSP